MANNLDVKDAAGLVKTVKTTESGGVHTPWHMLPDMLEVGPVSLSAAGVLFTQDVSNYGSVVVQVTSPGTTCTITYEASNDNTTWYSVAGYTPLNTGSTPPVSTSTAAILLIFPCLARYFRARVSTYTSGTVTVLAEFRAEAIPQLGVFVANAAANAVPIAFSGTVAPASSATGAMTKARVMSAASTNATSVKASAGRLYEIHLCNTSAALKFVKFYNKASAPTVGTDTPVATYPLAANGGRLDIVSINGISFATGIAYAITGAVADTDTTAVAANDIVGELLYA
ncbi:MAG: hypothetical protein HYX36_05220 [Rhizobiales bacterium]|nr:hypothetical protein [Hyphomicrobiales bacterium]